MTTTETYRRSSNLIIGKTATSPPSDLRRGLHTLASKRREADAYTSSRKSTFGMGADSQIIAQLLVRSWDDTWDD